METSINESERRLIATHLSRMAIARDLAVEDFGNLGMSNRRCKPLLHGAGMGPEPFAELAEIAAACGDEKLFIVDIYSSPDTMHIAASALEYDDFKDALVSRQDFMIFDTIILGRSGRWVAFLRGLEGGVLAADEDLLIDGAPCRNGLAKHFLSE